VRRCANLFVARLAFRARARTRTKDACIVGVVAVAGYEGVAGMESNGVHNLRGSVVRARGRDADQRAHSRIHNNFAMRYRISP